MSIVRLSVYYSIQILNFVKKIKVSVSIFEKYDKIEK